jgi:hypothetical protein
MYRDAQDMIREEKYEEGIRLLEELLKAYPGYALAHNDPGNANAIEMLRQIRKRFRQGATILKELGVKDLVVKSEKIYRVGKQTGNR